MVRRYSALVASMVMVAGIAAPAVALPDPDPTGVTAVATLDKEASETEVVPGETFTYTLTIGCSSITDAGCRGAVLTDVVPAPFEVVEVTVGGGANSAEDPVVSGNNVTVTWSTSLGDGTFGLLDATTGIVEITARLPENVSYDDSGIPVVNNARIEGVNFVDEDDKAAVTPVVPLDLGTSPTKTFAPKSSIGTAGNSVSAALTAVNESNGTVESLVIQDPVDPAAAPNPFDYLAYAGFGTVTPPAGATTTAYEVFAGGAWIGAPNGTLPGGVNPADVKGTRVTFTGEIPAGATAAVGLDLATTQLAAAQPDGFVVTNSVESVVALGGESARDDSSDTFTLLANDIQVDASKTFDPDLVIAGESSTVTLGATNASTVALDGLTIREPATGSFPAAYAFGGITSGIDHPAGATSGKVVYHLLNGTTEEVTFADGATPAPPAGAIAEVTSFEVVFEGEIAPGGETSVVFDVVTAADLAGLPLTVPNKVAVVGENDGAAAEDTAVDDLFIYDEVIETYISKQIRPDQILAVPGESVTVSLKGGLTERPKPPASPSGTTGHAAQIVLQDPQDPVEPNPWWNAFDLTAVTQTPVPADSSLTVEYYDTTDNTWKTLAGPVAGPTIYSQPVAAGIRAVAGGVRFVYDYTGAEAGFPPGTDLAPNFTSELRPGGRYEPGPPFSDNESTFVPNCAQSGATSGTPGVPGAESVMPTADCPEIELIPADPGNADLVDKEYGTSSSGGDKSVIARSGDTIPSTLRWSTGGFSNFERVEITDVADPEGTAVADSVYDAFNLIRIAPITPAADEFIAYDQVQRVELWDGSDWTPAANDPCPGGCVGQFPGLSLTAGEQLTTLGVRLVFTEGSGRAAASVGNLAAPPVGSGVARSFGNTRPIDLIWQVRDSKRSDSTPVLGEDVYNLAGPGVVRNTVNASGYPAGGGAAVTANDRDDVVIIDVPLTTTTDKNWQGGPLSVPADPSIPSNQYPLSRVTVTTRNTTPARVDHLQITDVAPGSATDRRHDPFQAFLFNRFTSITEPVGTQSTVVTLFCPGGASTTYTRTEALDLLPGALPCDVTGVQVAFDGRIASNAAGVMVFDVRLRPFWRGTAERITPADSPIINTAEGIVADIDNVGTCPPPADVRRACDEGSASIALEEPSFKVTAGKSIAPAEQDIGDFAPVTVTLSGQPGGATRAVTMTLTDDDPTFWNAVDFLGVDPSWTLPTPLGRVRACYLDGGTFTAADVQADSIGGGWTCQPLAATMGVAEAAAFLGAAPASLHGVSFQFWQSNGLGWQNPSNPVVRVPFLVERRTDLRTGDPVPTTRSDQVAAPGEEDAGIFFDTVEVDGESVAIGAGQFLTDTDSANAEYRHTHLEAGVSVSKTPTGDVRPGAVIPFVLTFVNTGEAPLTDPVFTDELPTDGQGRQLVFDPDRDPSVSPYRFQLTGAAPPAPNGTPLPIDPADIDIEEVGDKIVFRMPPGSVLEPGQRYTITVGLMLRPGLTPNDDVQNWAAIKATEPFDDCVRVLDAATGECRDDTVVSPLAVPALSTVKYVKADEPHGESGIPETFSTANDFDCAGTANADGFYRAPCVPVTLPGGTETWRFTVTNAGTLPMDRVVSIDNLPVPGDQGLIVTLPRESDWRPTFASGVELVQAGGTPAGAMLTTYYSTSSQPCTADLNPLGTPCAAGAWLPLDGSVDPALVRSLKFQVDFPDQLFQPGQALTLQFRTRTTPGKSVDKDFPIAYNTVSTGGSALAGGSAVRVPATEGRRVGVSYPTGPVRLQKTVTGPGSGFAPDEFPVQLTCTSAGAVLAGLPRLVLVPGGSPEQVDGLPWGAECTATEGNNGQSSEIIGTAVVGGPGDEIGIVGVENVFELGELEITKTVQSSAVDHEGQPVSYGPFEVTVTCDFLGGSVFADGYDAGRPMVKDLADDETWTLTGLPATADCAVEETDDAGATSSTVTPSVLEVPAASTGTVAIVNTYDVGSLALQKVVTGTGAQDFGDGPFTLHVTCVLDDASGERTVYDDDILLGGGQPLQARLDNLAAGAECTVTETDPAGAHDVVVDPGTVVIAADQVVDVTITNTFRAGALTVVKDVQGAGAELYGAGPFEVEVTCTRAGADGPVELPIPGGATRSLTRANSYTVTYGSLLVGAVCKVAETRNGGANETAIVDGNGEPIAEITIPDGQTAAEVRVVNTFRLGSIAVRKTISGAGADLADGRSFTVRLTCTREVDGTIRKVSIPGGATRTVSRKEGLTASYADLPVGAGCTLVETRGGGADTTTITPNGGDPEIGVVVVGEGAATRITVKNTYSGGLPGSEGVAGAGDLGDTGASRTTTYAAVLGLVLLVAGGGLLMIGRTRRRA